MAKKHKTQLQSQGPVGLIETVPHTESQQAGSEGLRVNSDMAGRLTPRTEDRHTSKGERKMAGE
ncbi:hypothetical protein PAXRUDRAFT_21384 [Paxillus rubicundulus Ve08.2h10]|uniref:Uncharacterized protein n=1 Tax=Paxillus rubicundulus Ve08.2h10 TaxID=930991 RepID=A0A0D0CQ95_9AGAM|nr:hypothetical protein PAXRUDRAFT_21384 [Paxillus rubicundulus Ve08.2h10]